VSRRRAGPAAILALAAVLLAACGRPDRERVADTAYGAGRYADALAGYRAVSQGKPRARVWAKLGAAALHTGDLRESAEAFLRLATDDPTRADEAAEGLESVARAAERAGNDDVLREVVTGLQAVAPGRTTTAYALVLAQRATTDTAELVALLPGALAAASAPETVDSLLTRYARALESGAGCGQALLVYRAVLRRTQDSALRAPARRGAGDCAYALGIRSDSAGRVDDAALWFAEAARVDSTTPTGRRALVRYADTRLTQGDTLAAVLTLQAVAAGGTIDSMSQAAAGRLVALGFTSSAGDSAGSGVR
jgi:tetratricopeptide (TPR) repeat protein